MDDYEWLWIAIAAYAAYLVFQKLNKPLDKLQTTNALTNAGAQPYDAPAGTFVQLGNDTFKIPERGWDLNFAQKVLIGLDRIVPGTWLTKLAIT